jgi:hypothetical protein
MHLLALEMKLIFLNIILVIELAINCVILFCMIILVLYDNNDLDDNNDLYANNDLYDTIDLYDNNDVHENRAEHDKR